MGLVQKIFYTHLPLAWWSFVSFFLVCVSGVAYLKTRNRHWDAVAGAAAEVGVVLSGLALVSAPSGRAIRGASGGRGTRA